MTRLLRPLVLALLLAVGVARPADALLQAAGPIVPANGFPQYYQDASGLTLTQCLDTTGLCGVVVPNSLIPLAFPSNFPVEFFFWDATTVMATNSGGQALVNFSMTAGFSANLVAAGDQVVFARMRVRIDNLQAGATYRITHPFGVDSFVALGAGARGINRTVDIGLCPGDFQGALNGRIGPFLVWDAAESTPPAGYIGDPNVLHTVVGSPVGTNFVRIEGPNIGGPGVNLIETNRFALTGKLETAPVPQPVTAERASYTRTPTGNAISLYVQSVASASLTAESSTIAPTTLAKDPLTGRFFGYLTQAAGATLPSSLTIRNVADASATPVTVLVGDQVVISQALYDPLSQRLRVDAASGDTVVPPTLTLAGYGVIPASGSLLVGAYGPPSTVIVTSSAGGRASATVSVQAGALPATTAPVASAGPDQAVLGAATVLLSGAVSGFGSATLAWSQISGPAVTLAPGSAPGLATFTAPIVTATTTLTFRLTAASSAGISTDDVAIAIAGPKVTAVIASVPAVAIGSTVALDGSGSTGGVTGYAWVQTAGPAVTLTGAATAKPTFVFPASAVVGQLNGVATLQFRLTVTAPGGTATALVAVANTPSKDLLTATKVAYVSSKTRWDFAGTASLKTGNAVTAYLGLPSAGKPIGKGAVAGTGSWLFTVAPSTVTATATSQVYLVSDMGGQLGPLTISFK